MANLIRIRDILLEDKFILGIDFGAKKLGIAVGNRMVATPVACIYRRTLDYDLQQLNNYVCHYGIEAFVVGIPILKNGGTGKQCKLVEKFCGYVSAYFNKPVVVYDETLTTVSAERSLRNMGCKGVKLYAKIDQVAACCILQNFLNYLQQTSLI